MRSYTIETTHSVFLDERRKRVRRCLLIRFLSNGLKNHKVSEVLKSLRERERARPGVDEGRKIAPIIVIRTPNPQIETGFSFRCQDFVIFVLFFGTKNVKKLSCHFASQSVVSANLILYSFQTKIHQKN